MIRAMQLSVLTALLATTLLVGGCSSSIDSESLRANWTPELLSTTETEEQYWNSRTIYRDNYMRQIHEDWANIWFEGRNLRLTRYAMP